MVVLKIKNKDYKLKFGYKSFKKSGVLREVVAMQNELKDSKEDSEDGTGNIELLEQVFEANSKLVLAALQKYNEEFRVDYNNPESVQECIEKVDDLMDDYMEEEDAMPVMDLFSALTNELFNNGFLLRKSEKLEKNLAEQDSTIVPADHKKKEN